MKPSVFILDDERSLCEALKFSLKSDYAVEYSTDPEQGIRQIRSKAYDVLLLDMRLGTLDGMDILHSIYSIGMDIEVIVMTAHGNDKNAIDALELGAFSYLRKPVKINELKLIIQRAIEHRRLSDNVSFLASELNSQKEGHIQIIGNSHLMHQVFRQIDSYKDVDSNVLITGESGTGKELVARAIHSFGKRKNERFIAVNCAAIPEGLLESELFGHIKGAFTSAVSNQKGKFLLADKGTIFLDEIGDMPLTLQAKILRVLQEKEIAPVGSADTIPVDVRVIAATNRDLGELVATGAFRRDLFYRLNVANLRMPSLRERPEDIIPLCEHFLSTFSKEQKKNIQSISERAKEKLLRYKYPGNVRQLANIIEHAVILTKSDVLSDFALPDELEDSAHLSSHENELFNLLGHCTLQEAELLTIKAALARHKGRRQDMAAALGISERALYYKMNKHGLN